MRIGIDARWIFKEITGIESYTRELIRYLALIDRDNEYIVFFNDEELKNRTVNETNLQDARNFKPHMLPFGVFSLRNQLAMPRILEECRLDVFHSSNYMIPLKAFPQNRQARIRCVVNIHDLIPLMFPEYTPRSKKRRVFPVYRWLMRQVGMRSDIIITGSQSARKDIIHWLKITPEREKNILAIPDGVGERFKPLQLDNDGSDNNTKGIEAKQYHRKIVLWVGRPDPYKNVIKLVEAFARLRNQYRFPVELRMVGPKDARYPEAERRAVKLKIADSVSWTGYVTDEQLVREYQQADVFVLPSLYEGFGLTVLEAMACGTPVICSNKGALPEVAGNAALKVQPDDVIGLCEGVKRVLTDWQLAKDMVARGIQQAKKFTWKNTAEQTLHAYRKALE